MLLSRYPAAINMGSCGKNMANMPMDVPGMDMSGSNRGAMSPSSGACTAVTSLQAPQTAAQIDTFTLTAQPAHLSLGAGAAVDAWTFNGTAPGPTLRVRQGDLVVVHLVNHLAFGVTIHWHGVAVPNASDGAAGVTQDAVQPGQSYIYRFVAKEPGTYWYHSHQESFTQVTQGLYGMLIVYLATPIEHDNIDAPVALHEWNGKLAINQTTGTLRIPAQPGDWARLRIANTSAQQLVTLLGAPFTVVALDGHELNRPTPVSAQLLPIGEGQRYDLRFQMPASGPVTLVTANGNGALQHTPAVVVGDGNPPIVLPTVSPQWFDFSTYGTRRPDPITQRSHFDATYTITLGGGLGFSNGRFGPIFTLDGKTFPDTPTILVRPGQLVRFHIVNQSGETHPMHLHGHTFAVLSRDGHALSGSPVYLDTVNIQPHETYDLAFYANNPGLWMFHCHDLYHANHGMDMMVVYPNISTPSTIGSASGNFPD
jgi:FtsP/CotA-like multicopper oxidase with cupredoxin domain